MSSTAILLPWRPNSQQPFRSLFDRVPFHFSHCLHQSNYFCNQALQRLVEQAAGTPNSFYVEDGDSNPGAGWATQPGDTPLTEIWSSLHRRKAFILLKGVEEQPAYGEILKMVVGDLATLTGIDIGTQYRNGRMTLILPSPGRVTPYHIDDSANLLIQIRGSKTVYIFDGNDREILSEEELEQYWSGDIYAPHYREQFQPRAWNFPLEPGLGVVNPVTFPHWVKNDEEISISLSINFRRATDEEANVRRINGQFRRMGLHPSTPGLHPLVDHTKSNLYDAAHTLKKKIEGFRHHSGQAG